MSRYCAKMSIGNNVRMGNQGPVRLIVCSPQSQIIRAAESGTTLIFKLGVDLDEGQVYEVIRPIFGFI